MRTRIPRRASVENADCSEHAASYSHNNKECSENLWDWFINAEEWRLKGLQKMTTLSEVSLGAIFGMCLQRSCGNNCEVS